MMNRLVHGFLFVLLLAASAQAQFTDAFDDGDFTSNPAWQGDTDVWTVVDLAGDFYLRTSGPAQADTLVLTTPSSVSDGMWTFTFRHENVNLSTANGVRVFLMASSANLTGEVYGYFVQFGTNNNDRVELFRIDGSSDTADRVRIGQSAEAVLAGETNEITLTVTRSPSGEWRVLSGDTELFTAQDATYTQSSHFGLWAKHSSANGASFYFDDFAVEGTQDTTAPTLTGVAYDADVPGVLLTFSEPLDPATFEGAFTVEHVSGQPVALAGVTPEQNDTAVRLIFQAPLEAGTYTVFVEGVQDLAGNAIAPNTTATFQAQTTAGPAEGDIVVNEIMYNPPDTESGEYVELHNPTENTYDLRNFRLADDRLQSVPISNQQLLIPPGGYVVLVRDEAAFRATFPDAGTVTVVNSWPALNNTGDAVVLLDERENVIDSVTFQSSWGGTDAALERRDPLGPSSSATNWATSTAPERGTPGRQNSVFAPDETPPAIAAVQTTNEGDLLTVTFDEPLDPASVDANDFTLPGSTITAASYEDASQRVTLTLAPMLQPGTHTLTVSGVSDLRGNVLTNGQFTFEYTPDRTPPDLVSVTAVSASEVRVVFSEPVDSASAVTLANYTLSNAQTGDPASITGLIFNPNSNPLALTLLIQPPLQNGATYRLTVRHVADVFGNVLDSDEEVFRYLVATPPAPREVVINEIHYDPELAAEEFVEIYNRTGIPASEGGTGGPEKAVDLANLRFSDDRGLPVALTQTPTILESGAYAVLVRDETAFRDRFEDVLPTGTTVVQVASWPALNDGGDAAVLWSGTTVIDSVRYSSNWGGSNGPSLERRDPAGPSQSAANWGSSTAEAGATPGARNSLFAIDTTPPEVVFAAQLSPTILDVVFSEPVDTTALGLASFSASGQAPASLAFFDGGARIRLTFSEAVTAGSISVTNVRDLKGNVLDAATIPVARSPQPGEVVLTEIMYDPGSGSEYVEIYNDSEHTINLGALLLADARDTTRVSAEFARLAPGAYLALVRTPAAFEQVFPDVPYQAVSSFPSLDNGGDTVRLLAADSTTLDVVTYHPSWHFPDLSTTSGLSLEKRSPFLPSNDPGSWSTSVAPAGGTPGAPNSLGEVPPDGEEGLTVTPSTFSPDNDGMDDAAVIRYALRADAASIRVRIYDAAGRLVRTLEEATLAGRTGFLTWNGFGEDNQTLRLGIYIVVLEAVSPTGGTVEAYRKPIVLARRLN